VKQLLFMIVLTLAGTAGVYVVSPFWGVLVYYLFAVLRPQYMWKWSLPEGVSWSFYVAVATIGAAVASVLGVRLGVPAKDEAGTPAPRFSTAHRAVLVFGGWVAITALTAQYPSVSFPYLIEYVKVMVMFSVATSLIRTVRQVWALLLATALALAYISYEINYLYLVNNYLGVFHNGYGGLDNNGAGLMLAMGVPMCWFIFENAGRWWRWVFLALIPVSIHAVLMTYSRGAMVSLLGMCPLLLLRSRQRVRLAVAGSLLGFVALPVMVGPQIKARFMTLEHSEMDDSANSRRDSWAAAFKMACDYPVFGVGIRNANLLSHQYGADYEGRTIHSNYLQIAADSGFPGLALLLVAFGAAWWSARRARRFVAGRDDPEARMVYAIACSAECAMLVFCIGSAFLSFETFELPYLLLLLAAQVTVLSGASAKGGRLGGLAGAPPDGLHPACPAYPGGLGGPGAWPQQA
jgi:probable O-glycosylation ligase (exosortase A-associated)